MMQVLKDVGGVEFPDTFANFAGNGHAPADEKIADSPTTKEPSKTETTTKSPIA
jgi:hypothetical protein